MNISIRTAKADDALAISLLSKQLGYDISEHQTRSQLDVITNSANDIACVAVEGDHVIGWIHVFYTVRLECMPYCEIAGLVVDESYRGMGMGKMLITYIEPWFIQRKCRKLVVRSNVKRADAHRFYAQSGFTVVKEQKIFEKRNE